MKEKHGKRTRKTDIDKRYQTLKLIIFRIVHLCWDCQSFRKWQRKAKRDRGEERSESGIKVR